MQDLILVMNFLNLDKILYLDCDMIVQYQIEKLYDFCNIKKSPLYANNVYTFCTQLDKKYIMLKKMDPNKKYFNAGVYYTSLSYWRKNNIKAQIRPSNKPKAKMREGQSFSLDDAINNTYKKRVA